MVYDSKKALNGLIRGDAYDKFFENQEAKALCTCFYEFLSHKEAAQYLKISEGELRNKTSNGTIPYYKIGRRNLYRLSEMRSFVLSQKRGGNIGN